MMDWYPDWTGQACFILGGGPSLKGFDAEILRQHRVIGINEAGLTMAPWCDVLFWGDSRWHTWNKDRLHLHIGPLKVYRHSGHIPGAHRIPYRPPHNYGMHWGRGAVGGCESGSSAINLAVHFGAAVIVLLGFDMRDALPGAGNGNWHTMHKMPPAPDSRRKKFAPAHGAMACDLMVRRPGLKVLNATLDSALACWPKVKLKDVLDDHGGLRPEIRRQIHPGVGAETASRGSGAYEPAASVRLPQRRGGAVRAHPAG